MNKPFLLSESDATRLMSWWKSLDENRGDRAQLRRASNAEDILLIPAFARFLSQMPSKWSENKTILLFDAAMVAAVVARVKKNSDVSFARGLALPKEGGSRASMSELRFQQLQKSRTEDEFFRRICRALAILDGKVGVVDLADSILLWLREHRTSVARKPEQRLAVRWATDYYTTLRD